MSVCKVLVVEDDVIIGTLIENRLTALGYTVVGRASRGEDAVRKAGDMSPDIVLMDIRLKGKMDGIEAAEMIYGLYDIPVIYLTAYSDESTLERAEKTSPFGYIIKPFSDEILHANIRMALHKHRKERENWEERKEILHNDTSWKDYS